VLEHATSFEQLSRVTDALGLKGVTSGPGSESEKIEVKLKVAAVPYGRAALDARRGRPDDLPRLRRRRCSPTSEHRRRAAGQITPRSKTRSTCWSAPTRTCSRTRSSVRARATTRPSTSRTRSSTTCRARTASRPTCCTATTTRSSTSIGSRGRSASASRFPRSAGSSTGATATRSPGTGA
jgi:hypothetical protein